MAFTTSDEVRLRHGFFAEANVVGEDLPVTTVIKLDTSSYAMISVEKNGTALTEVASGPVSGEFSFTRPKTVTLGDAAVTTDLFVLTYETELSPTVITSFMDQATAEVKAILIRRFGITTVEDWDSPGPAPAFVISLTTELAGIHAERSMLRKGHTFDPKAMNILNDEVGRIMDMLSSIDRGKLILPGETSIGGDPLVARGADAVPNVFANLDDLQDVDFKRLDRKFGTDGRALDPAIATNARRGTQ